MENPIKIIFTDDKAKFRQSIILVLEQFNIITIGEAGNGAELLDLLKFTQPDVVLLDLEMPIMDGNAAMVEIQKRFPKTKIIIISWHDGFELIDNYSHRGVHGYVSKDEMCGDIELLVQAIRKVKEGGTYFHHPPKKQTKKLTPLQEVIVPLLCDGFTNKEIAQELGLKERGVEKQRHKIYEKNNAKTAADFFKSAFRKGLDFLGRKST